MNGNSAARSEHRLARIAGILYLLLFPTAAPGIMSGQMAVAESPEATLAGIEAGQTMFAVTTVLGVAGFIVFLLLAYALRRLFHSRGPVLADVMLLLVIASIGPGLAAMAYRVDILVLLAQTGGVPALAPRELADTVALSLAGSNNAMQLAVIFWGLWLFPLGLLAYRSTFVPSAIGVLLMIGSPFYVLAFLGGVFDWASQYPALLMIVGVVFGIPTMLGEFGIALWLAIKGAGWKAGVPNSAVRSPTD
ncbi:MAG TPA: DUF4386 domain-containing protein [Erythrobacter sp.]|nr:DUF4386 domain-containing protein [Erythrobacter sp.]